MLKKKARKAIAGLPDHARGRITRAVDQLVEEPRPAGCRKLQNCEGWRLRVGDYRLVYEVDDDKRVVTVLLIGHRRDVYRRG
ncbi:MAG: type II toxin-antitoxin system RelE family toxin [Rubrobacter sp.]